MATFIKVVNHGNNQIDLRHIGSTSVEARPTELHFNINGSVKDNPTLAIVMRLPSGLNVFGQMSLETLEECLNELGYEIKDVQ